MAGYTSGLAIANAHGVVLGLLMQQTLRDNVLTGPRATTIILAHKNGFVRHRDAPLYLRKSQYNVLLHRAFPEVLYSHIRVRPVPRQ